MDNTLYICLELLLNQRKYMLAHRSKEEDSTIWLSGGERSGKTSLPLIYKDHNPTKNVAVVAYTPRRRNTLRNLYDEKVKVIGCEEYNSVKLEEFDIIFLDTMYLGGFNNGTTENYNQLMELLRHIDKDIPVVAMPVINN